ncbi:unnamed protein product [Soboliphyme baturini]|uniref:Vacuolar protein sorting-associated protein 16 homolog n=1 Tax=Soboliphyme baturini TaxID=241478 RepID=A0A183INM0_9BILA|nr:unnamed protein product [Soboliphyme baturini]
MKVAACRTFPAYNFSSTSLVVMCNSSRFFVVNNVSHPKFWQSSIINVFLSLNYDCNVMLVQEMDGIRIYTPKIQEFLCEVEDWTFRVFGIGSLDYGSILLEAFLHFQNKSFKSFEYMHLIENHMNEAIQTCVQAALHSFQRQQQKNLMQAAAYGKLFVPESDSTFFSSACRTLRILNSLRDSHFAMPMTYTEFNALTVPRLIDRLINRSEYPLAIACSNYLRLDPKIGTERILMQWARKLFQDKSRSETDIVSKLENRLSRMPGLYYSSIAEMAMQLGFKELAAKLYDRKCSSLLLSRTMQLYNKLQLVIFSIIAMILDYEADTEKQVFLLLRLGKTEKALANASESQNPELIYSVLLYMQNTVERKTDFSLILREFPVCFKYYKTYLKEENEDMAHCVAEETDDFFNQALFNLKEASDATIFEVNEKLGLLTKTEECFRNAKDEFFQSQAADNVKLLKTQVHLEERFSVPFVECSLRDTVRWLLTNGEQKEAEKLRKEFKISDQQYITVSFCQYWWWTIQAYGDAGYWKELEDFAKTKKSPIGYLPFVEIFCKYDQTALAESLMPKLSQTEKLTALIAMRCYSEAARLAFDQRDVFAMNRIVSLIGSLDRDEFEKVISLRDQLLEKL